MGASLRVRVRVAVGSDAPFPALRRRLRLGPAHRRRLRLTFLDTFDWRVFRAGGTLLLEEEPAARRLLWRTARRTLVTPAPESVRRLDDLPPGTLRSRLAGIVEVRALIPVGRARVERITAPVVDSVGKTTVRLELDVTTLEDAAGIDVGTARTTLSAEALPGYEKAHRRAVAVLSTLPGVVPADPDDLEAAAAAWGRRPGDYSSRFEISLGPQQAAADAVRAILLFLVGAIRANIDGAVDDVDSEFLHDLRVATRRTRAAISLLGDTLGEGHVAPYATKFRWLGGVTGPCRDLDVFRIHLDQLCAAVPEVDVAALDPLLQHLAAARAAAHEELVVALRSRRLAALLARWERFLRKGRPRGDHRPIRAVADARIGDAFRKVLRRGAAAGDENNAAALHRLRIAAKRLRYLVEFFASLYEPERVAVLSKKLRRLQDALGGVQDAIVQQRKLRSFAAEMEAAGTAPETLRAVGRLSAVVKRRGEAHLRESADCFARFAAPATRRTVRALVGTGKGDG